MFYLNLKDAPRRKLQTIRYWCLQHFASCLGILMYLVAEKNSLERKVENKRHAKTCSNKTWTTPATTRGKKCGASVLRSRIEESETR